MVSFDLKVLAKFGLCMLVLAKFLQLLVKCSCSQKKKHSNRMLADARKGHSMPLSRIAINFIDQEQEPF